MVKDDPHRATYEIINLPKEAPFASIESNLRQNFAGLKSRAQKSGEIPPHKEWKIINEMSIDETRALIAQRAENMAAHITGLPSEVAELLLAITERLADEGTVGNIAKFNLLLDALSPTRPGASTKVCTLPPVRGLTPSEIEAIKERAEKLRWPGKRGTSASWVADTYKQWIPGLLREHLLPDNNLYQAFSRLARDGKLPAGLDVPTADEKRAEKIANRRASEAACRARGAYPASAELKEQSAQKGLMKS